LSAVLQHSVTPNSRRWFRFQVRPYTYSYATLGELVAWIIGWDLIIEYAIGNVAVAISWAEFFNRLMRNLGIHIPDWLTSNYRTATEETLAAAPHIFGIPIVFNILAFGIVALITIVLVWGIKESSNFNAVMVLIKILVLLFFIGLALYYVSPHDGGALEAVPAARMVWHVYRRGRRFLRLHRL
jgi:amino acid transporter